MVLLFVADAPNNGCTHCPITPKLQRTNFFCFLYGCKIFINVQLSQYCVINITEKQNLTVSICFISWAFQNSMSYIQQLYSAISLVKIRGHSHNKRKRTNGMRALSGGQPIKSHVTISVWFLPIWRVSPPHIIIIRLRRYAMRIDLVTISSHYRYWILHGPRQWRPWWR